MQRLKNNLRNTLDPNTEICYKLHTKFRVEIVEFTYAQTLQSTSGC